MAEIPEHLRKIAEAAKARAASDSQRIKDLQALRNHAALVRADGSIVQETMLAFAAAYREAQALGFFAGIPADAIYEEFGKVRDATIGHGINAGSLFRAYNAVTNEMPVPTAELWQCMSDIDRIPPGETKPPTAADIRQQQELAAQAARTIISDRDSEVPRDDTSAAEDERYVDLLELLLGLRRRIPSAFMPRELNELLTILSDTVGTNLRDAGRRLKLALSVLTAPNPVIHWENADVDVTFSREPAEPTPDHEKVEVSINLARRDDKIGGTVTINHCGNDAMLDALIRLLVSKLL